MIETRQPRLLEKPQQLAGTMLLVPGLGLVVLLTIVPLLGSIAMSFTRFDLLSAPQWVGAANYIAVLSDPQFLQAAANTIQFAGGQVAIGVVVALLVAMLFNRELVGGPLMRTFIFLPHALSYVTVALLWSFLYDPTLGPINLVLERVGLGPINFLTDTALAMPSILAMSLWRNLGYFMIILLAGLKAVPPELIEAAHVDGAGWWARMIHITIPQLRSPLFFVVITWFMGGLQMFTQSYVMTQGGPVNATRTVVYDLYESAFLALDFGRAATVGVLLFVVVIVIALPVQLVATLRGRSRRG